MSCAIEITFIGQPEFHAIFNQQAEYWNSCTLLIKNNFIALIKDKIDAFTNLKDYTVWFKGTEVHYRIIPKLATYHHDIILNTTQGNIILSPKNNQKQFYFVDITFDNNSRPYTYLCSDESITIGDYVIVPVGADSDKKCVHVNDAYYATAETLHYPINKMKMVISKIENPPLFSDEHEDLMLDNNDFNLIHQTINTTKYTYDMISNQLIR